LIALESWLSGLKSCNPSSSPKRLETTLDFKQLLMPTIVEAKEMNPTFGSSAGWTNWFFLAFWIASLQHRATTMNLILEQANEAWDWVLLCASKFLLLTHHAVFVQ